MSSADGRDRRDGRHEVVVGGGGFGGLQAVRELRREPVGITLIDRRSFHLFLPLVYQVATGVLAAGEIAQQLRAIFRRDRAVRVLLWVRSAASTSTSPAGACASSACPMARARARSRTTR